MTRKEALTDLLAKVEAGDLHHRKLNLVFPDKVGVACPAYWARQAFQGSLDAATALHEAALPDVKRIRLWTNGGLFHCAVGPATRGISKGYESFARAWLIAIIKALIAMEDAG